MYVDAVLDRKDDVVRVVERHANGIRKFVDYPVEYNCYVKDARGTYHAIDGSTVRKCSFNSAKEFYRYIKDAKESQVQLYESDFSPLYKTLYANYSDKDIPIPNKLFFDIEADFDEVRGYAPIHDPFNSVTAISMYRAWTKELIILSIKPSTYTQEEAQKLNEELNAENDGMFVLCDDERSMLMLFLGLLEDADVISGWNSECYDIPYLVGRISRILGDTFLLKFSLWGMMPVEREAENYGKKIITYDFSGRVHMDYLSLFKKHNPQVRQSYKLDDIGMEVTGERKVPHDETLDQLYKEDYKRFLEYSRQDSRLLKLIDAKMDYISLHIRLAHQECVTLKTTLGSVDLIDTSIVNQIHRRGQVCFNKPEKVEENIEDDDVYDDSDDEDSFFSLPEQDEEKAEPKAAGAWVQDPITGIVKFPAVIDLNSLYPSTIRALNASTEGIIGQIRCTYTEKILEERISAQRAKKAKSKKFKPDWTAAWHGLFGVEEFNFVKDGTDDVIVIDFETGDVVTCTAKQLHDIIYAENSQYVLSANGTIFDRSKAGIIPEILAKWYNERKQMQGAKNNYIHLIKDGIEIPEDMLSELENL